MSLLRSPGGFRLGFTRCQVATHSGSVALRSQPRTWLIYTSLSGFRHLWERFSVEHEPEHVPFTAFSRRWRASVLETVIVRAKRWPTPSSSSVSCSPANEHKTQFVVELQSAESTAGGEATVSFPNHELKKEARVARLLHKADFNSLLVAALEISQHNDDKLSLFKLYSAQVIKMHKQTHKRRRCELWKNSHIQERDAQMEITPSPSETLHSCCLFVRSSLNPPEG